MKTIHTEKILSFPVPEAEAPFVESEPAEPASRGGRLLLLLELLTTLGILGMTAAVVFLFLFF